MIRSLGLALQFIAITLLTRIAEVAREVDGLENLGLFHGTGGVAHWLPPIAMFAAGCALAFGPRRCAVPTAIAYLLAEVAVLVWGGSGAFVPRSLGALLEVRMWFFTGSAAETALRLAWPAIVLAAVWTSRRSSSAAPSWRAEAGGVVAMLGLITLSLVLLNGVALALSISALENVALDGVMQIAAVAIATYLAIAWLALGAGHRLITGAPRPPLTALLLVMAIASGALVVIGALPLINQFMIEVPFQQLMRIAIAAALPLLTPICMGAYARRAGPLEQRLSPDRAAASGPVAWLVLWNTLSLLAQLFLGAYAGQPTAFWLAFVTAAASLAAFAAWLRAARRSMMWTAAIGAATTALHFVITLPFETVFPNQRLLDLATHLVTQVPKFAAEIVPLLLLAWLHRPSARRERGLDAAFE